MADNATANSGSGGKTFVTAQGTWSGDTADLAGSFQIIATGTEGSWTFDKVVGGAGAVSAGVQRVTLASDDPAVSALNTIASTGHPITGTVSVAGTVAATQSGPWTASVTDGGGSLTVDNAGTFAVQLSQYTPVTGRLPVDGSGVTQPVSDGGGSLTVDNGGTFAVQAAQSGTWNVTNAGTFAVQSAAAGDVAHDGVDSGNPVKVGFKATTALSSATLVADAHRANAVAGVDGVQIVRLNTNLEGIVSGVVAISDGSSQAVIAAQGAGVKIYITEVIMSNSDATNASSVDLRDGTAGTVKATFRVPAGSGCHKTLSTPLPFSANTAVAADPSGTPNAVTITLIGFKSKV